VIPVYELFIALRHLTSRRRQTLLCVLAIGLAVMILMWSQALMVGFTQELYDKMVDKMPHVTIEPKSNEEYIHLYRNLAQDIRTIDGVVAVSPVLAGQATFEYKASSKNVILQGILVNDHNSVLRINEDITQGSIRDIEAVPNGVVLGDALAEKLDVNIDDSIDASFPEARPTTLKVVGIIDTGTAQDESMAYTSLSTAQEFFDEPNVVNSIVVRVDHIDKAQAISNTIDTLGYPASSWKETNPEILQMLQFETIQNIVMLGLVLVIATFGIVSTLFMVVMKKTKEIGMLMAMGVSRKSILTIFIMESGILGLMGAVLGVAAGILISLMFGSYTFEAGQDAYGGITTIPYVVRIQDVVLIILFTFLLNLIAGIYPARRASKLNPVEAISGE
jgi:lipoprotein-releasing system permease protein